MIGEREEEKNEECIEKALFKDCNNRTGLSLEIGRPDPYLVDPSTHREKWVDPSPNPFSSCRLYGLTHFLRGRPIDPYFFLFRVSIVWALNVRDVKLSTQRVLNGLVRP